jgi:hypothetical protein
VVLLEMGGKRYRPSFVEHGKVGHWRPRSWGHVGILWVSHALVNQ